MASLRAAAASIVRKVITPLGGDLRFIREDVSNLNGSGTGVEYWREGLERRMPRYWELTWHGRVLVRVRSHHNERAYWRGRRDLITLLEEMNARSVLPPLEASSRVLEPGCNVAQNLWAISRRWNCEIFGLDIDRAALAEAEKRPWRRPAHFAHGNVLEPGTLARFADQQFDLVLTRWHLIHLPAGEAKQQYLRELRRVGRRGLILEPTSPGKTGQVEWRQKDTYCVSWDDWEGWYGLRRFEPTVPLAYTDVFYW
ncbi:MAG TPA: class I SAM-dependent methyltransferase [Methylomirabilota bacterium]|nr:class I SAM-dependent methyltransferase [Methylomirabilota bacterium]